MIGRFLPRGITVRVEKWAVRSIVALLLILGSYALFAEDEPAEPLDIGQVEEVEVQLVLLDVLVLDRRDRTIPDLTAEEFDVLVDHKLVEIDSLDVHCPLGEATDPRAGETVEIPTEERDSRPPRRFVHAFDYYHMDVAAETIEGARQAVRKLSSGQEEHMIVAIGPGLRVELPFTTDLDEVDRTLERMYSDPGLYAGFYGRLTDRRFYRKLRALFDVLELVPGHKVVVLYSGPFPPDGFNHDSEYKAIASMSAKARVSLYPVDSGGVRTPRRFRYGDLGGPKDLARMAVETGGRVTHNTNDLGLAYARAQRDLGCRYTIGFYDRRPRQDRSRRVAIFVRRSGVRVVHPVYYVLRSDGKQLASQVRTAKMAPEVFDAGGMTAELLALRPHSSRKWDSLVAVGLPPRVFAQGQGQPWKLDVTIGTPSGATIRKFKRVIDASAGSTVGVADSQRAVVEPVELKPGHYRLSVVLSRTGMEAPLATHFDVELPTIPKNEPFLVGPHLGFYTASDRSSIDGPESVAPAEGQWRFEPLVERSAARGETIDALTWICLVGDDPVDPAPTVRRELTNLSGRTVGTFDTVNVELDDPEKVNCHAFVDSVPTAELQPGRYAVRAYLPDDEARGTGAQIAFAVTP
jgi:VWFA-related protein